MFDYLTEYPKVFKIKQYAHFKNEDIVESEDPPRDTSKCWLGPHFYAYDPDTNHWIAYAVRTGRELDHIPHPYTSQFDPIKAYDDAMSIIS